MLTISLEALKQLLIIERTPEPEPDLLDGLTAEERQEIQEMAERFRVCLICGFH
jgi:hypothetical protein